MNESNMLKQLGQTFLQARESGRLTQEQVADLAGVSRQRYHLIETGAAAAKATTLINISRALGMEMMLIPQRMVPAVESILRPAKDDEEDRPAFEADPDPDDDDESYQRRP